MIRIPFARYAIVLLVVGAATVGVVAAQTAPRPATPPATAPAQTTPQAPATAPPAAPAVVLPFPADARIGFVNMQLVVSQSKLGRTGQEQMQSLDSKKTAELTALNKAIQQLQQEITTGSGVLSAAILTQKNQDLDRKQREMQFAQEQARSDLQTLQDQLLEEFSKKVLPIVEQIRAEKNLWVVLGVGEATGIAAINPALELTSEIVKRLDASK